MIPQEKPKRADLLSDDLAPIVRQFYVKLFIYLMIAPLILGLIFGLPIMLLNNLPDRLNAHCTTENDEFSVRIISETRRINETRYLWSNDNAETWQRIKTVEEDYRVAEANCDAVQFNENGLTIIELANSTIIIDADGTISE